MRHVAFNKDLFLSVYGFNLLFGFCLKAIFFFHCYDVFFFHCLQRCIYFAVYIVMFVVNDDRF
uniref:Uncharacterized protein n=1 Tax=Sinocyclocheilus grahami TaxID=75366 RepID=A0A672KBJ3_SINGR